MSRDEAMGMGGKSRGGTSSGNTGGNGDNNREQYGAVGQYSGDTSTTNEGGRIEPPYVIVNGQKFAVDDPKAIEATNIVETENLLDKTLDLYQTFSPIGNVLNLGTSVLSTIGDLSSSLTNKAIEFDLQNRLQKAYQDPTFDPFSPDESVTQLEQDLTRAKEGNFTQTEYEDKYGKGEDDEESKGGDERALRNALTPYAPFAITNTTPNPSMVNNSFANMQNNNIETAYAQAKANLNTILSPTNTQFGYSASPYVLFSRENLTNNPFNIEYLQQRGLI